MLAQFLTDETTGRPDGPPFPKWIALAILLANEARGVLVAWEGAKLMGWAG